MPDTLQSGPLQRSRKLLSAAAIVCLSASLGVLADWRAPGIGRYAKDWLMRERGPLPVPQEIAIVAIDEKSIGVFGRFPWPRAVIAKAIDAISNAHPKAIAVDVLFSDPTIREEDEILARSIGRAGNVVLAAQLIDAPEHNGPSTWLMPLRELSAAAAGIGHVNVQVEAENIAREVALQAADDHGRSVRALALEAIRVGDRVPPQSVVFTGHEMVVGSRTFPVNSSSSAVFAAEGGSRAPVRLATGRIPIDYIGPAGSFEPVTYSVADVLRGAVPASNLQGKYVLLGVTAASEGDRLASPFLHQSDAQGDDHGVLMPGVEVLANSLNTMLRGRFYSDTGAMGSFLWAALIASLTLFALERSQGRMEMIRHGAAILALSATVLFAAYFEFTQLLVYPPLVSALVALGSAAVFGVLWRALSASSQLDASLAQLTLSTDIFAPPPAFREFGKPARFPRGLEWKARKVRALNATLSERAQFINLALRSVEDGLLIASPEGRITFANRGAETILSKTSAGLTGADLLRTLGIPDDGLISALAASRRPVEREIELGGTRPRRYALRLASVAESDHDPVRGIVASLSDVTRHHELQQTKNDVIALVSHEMRTPLTSIQGMAELLSTYDLDAPTRKEMSAVINSEVKRLTRMITEYLDITRLEAGATPVQKTPVKLATLLQRAILLMEPLAAKRGIRITLDVEQLPTVLADVDLLSRAVQNLLSNAIKYTKPDTEVAVTARRDDGYAAISIADQGVGIPEDDLPRIFEKFYRVPRLEDADVPGTGLGLPLVREIADLHNGSVNVTSTINVGSIFTLRIPLPQADTLER
jgi:signal transduction histidine kinase